MKPEIVWLHYLLIRWGKWSIRQSAGGLGYARMSLLVGASAGDGGHDPSPPPDVTDFDFDAVSAAIGRLSIESAATLVGFYVHGADRSFHRIAREAGVHRDTLERKILSAHRLLEPMLRK